MDIIRPINTDEDITDYSSSLAVLLFKDILRDNGLSYYENHLEVVANLVKGFLLPSEYMGSAVSAAFLHDAAEDIENIDVFDPFNNGTNNNNETNNETKTGNERTEGVIYLNDLFERASVQRDYICYIVNLLTHRKGISYQDYLDNLFTVPEQSMLRDLHILASGIKLADIRSNTAPGMGPNTIDLVEQYRKMHGAKEDELREFYKRTKVIDAFVFKEDLSIDMELFMTTLHRKFKAKIEANAINVLSYYIPNAENLFFNGYKETAKLFKLDIIRQALIGICIDCMRVYPGEDPLHVVNKLGENRSAPKVEGYKTVFSEVRDGVLNGIYEI